MWAIPVIRSQILFVLNVIIKKYLRCAYVATLGKVTINCKYCNVVI